MDMRTKKIVIVTFLLILRERIGALRLIRELQFVSITDALHEIASFF
jgi:hypothetical protein